MELTELNEPLKNACLEEITHLVCDADKKINTTFISNKWNLSPKDSETVLMEWLNLHKKISVKREFLLRGVDKNGNGLITILQDTKLDTAQKKLKDSFSSLYSIELATASNVNRLNILQLTECKVISLPLQHVERDTGVKSIPVVKVKEEIKTEIPKKGLPFFKINEKVEAKTVKVEKVDNVEKNSPKKQSPKESPKESPKKQSPKKKLIKTPKLSSGKASIASFFSPGLKGKPVDEKKDVSNSTVVKESSDLSPDIFESPLMEIDECEKSSSEKVEKDSKPSEVKSANKRSFVEVDDDGDDEIPNTPQDTKKIKRSSKRNIKKSAKHSRIMKVEDSSDDDDMNDERQKILESPVKEKENTTPPKSDVTIINGEKIKRKAKKTIARTYKDEEGYLVTTNEIVEYSVSEDETSDKESKVSETTESKTLDSQVKPEITSDKTSKKNKNSLPNVPSKQGSILNFFKKK